MSKFISVLYTNLTYLQVQKVEELKWHCGVILYINEHYNCIFCTNPECTILVKDTNVAVMIVKADDLFILLQK